MGNNRSSANRVRWRGLFLAVAFTMVLAACGDEGSDAPAVTTTSAPAGAPTTAAAPASTARGGGETCTSLAAKAVDLLQRWRNDMRGIAGPQYEEQHRAEARALAAQAKDLGCPVPAGAERIIDG